MDTESGNPFVGPRPLRVREKIYGRNREIDELFELLTAERIVWLHSPSGAGKTSLIQAGLIPLLEQDGFQVWRTIRVGSELTEDDVAAGTTSLNRYVLSTIRNLEEGLLDAQRTPDDELRQLTLDDYLKRRPDPPGVTNSVVLFFDQFEEVLTVEPLAAEAEKQRKSFFHQLGIVLQNRYVWALFALREEYLPALHQYGEYLPTGLSNTFRLDLLKAPQAREAITETAKRQGRREFQDAAALRLVTDLSKVSEKRADGTLETKPGQYVEPVQLQVVGHNLWEKLAPGESPVTVADVELAGVDLVDDALSEYYRRQVQNAATKSGVSERAIRDWVERKLVTGEGIRTQVIQEQDASGGLKNEAIRLLENAHLIRSEKRAGAIWYELAHDRLVEPVRSSNAEWFKEHLSLLQRQTDNWVRERRPDGLLLRDDALADAERWAAKNASELKDVERDFLEKSRAAQRVVLERRRKNRLIRVLAGVATVIAILAFAFFLRARSAEGEANQQAERASAAETKALDEAKNAREAEARATTEAANARVAETLAKEEAENARAAEARARAQAERASVAEAKAVEEKEHALAAEATATMEAERAAKAEQKALALQQDADNKLEALVAALEEQLTSKEPAAVLYALESLLRIDAKEQVSALITREDLKDWFRVPTDERQATSERNFVSLVLALDRATLERPSTNWPTLRRYLGERFGEVRGIGSPPARRAEVELEEDTFSMGSSDAKYALARDEQPLRDVKVSTFWIQEHEVTNGEYRRFDPQHAPGEPDPLPVVNVTWYEAMAYAAWLGGSLPTEAQWEYAAMKFAASTKDQVAEVLTAPPASADGVLDFMVGNVWEWCRDVYAPYAPSPGQGEIVENPLGPNNGAQRVLRGGSFYNVGNEGDAHYLNGTSRNFLVPDDPQRIVGFRVAWTDAPSPTTSAAKGADLQRRR